MNKFILLFFALSGIFTGIKIYDNSYSLDNHKTKTLDHETLEKLKVMYPLGDIEYEYNELDVTFSDDKCFNLINLKYTIDLTNTIIYLYDSCNNKFMDIIAAEYQYPDGLKEIRSNTVNNKIYKTTISNYLGEYQENYHITLTDSIVEVWTIDKGQKITLAKDSIRTSKKYIH